MAVAVVFAVLVVGAGYATMRALGLAKGPVGLGLAANAGLAATSMLGTWAVAAHVPPPVPGLAVVALGLSGVVLAARDARVVSGLSFRARAAPLAILGAGLAVPCVLSLTTFGSVEVPLSTHDGAYHTEIIHAFRAGSVVSDWYPKGTAAVFAAILQLLPWVDSAKGAFQLGTGLLLLAVLGVWGLAAVLFRSLHVAGLSAAFLSLTYLFPYFPQIWSGWPLSIGLILVAGLWAAAVEYLREPSWRWAALSGLMLGAVIVVHGSELYTTALILLVVLASWRAPVAWRRLIRDVVLGLAVATVCAAPYLPTLVPWAAGGGAYFVGLGGEEPVRSDPGVAPFLPLHIIFAIEALGIDLPLRLVLLVAGIWWTIRQRVATSLLGVAALFLALTWVFTYQASVPIVRQVYAIMFPWALHYRLLMLVALAQSFLAAAGTVALLHSLARWPAFAADQPSPTVRRIRRLGRLLVPTWLIVMTWAMGAFVGLQVEAVEAYSADDAAAMQWLRENVPRGIVVANDGFADAGIWAPYKAGVEILTTRSRPQDGTDGQRQLVAENILRLHEVPEAAATACALRVGYLYRGAKTSDWDTRRFPPLEELRTLPYLVEVFRQGGASVFRVRFACA